jgi:hypothetical protein
MPDEIEAVTETAKAVQEVAKVGGKAIDATRELGVFVAKVLGTVPEDTVGILGGDLLHNARIRIASKFAKRTNEILLARGVERPEPVSPSVAVPLLQAAQDEDRPELQELWARLLANAMDPAKSNSVRLEFIEALKRFHPRDAVILQKMGEQSGQFSPNTRDFFAALVRNEGAAFAELFLAFGPRASPE